MVSAFDSCTDSCGWTFAVIGALAYGSFGVPIRHTKHIDVHPLVLQSYKTFVIFILSWCVPLLGVDIAFTKWGFLSGLLWVVGGTGGIYGIRMAGLAVAVGTWASIMIMVNFVFGILVFAEPVYDIWDTCCSFLLLILGLVGMSRFSAPKPKEQEVVSGDYIQQQEPEEPLIHAELFNGAVKLTKRQCGIAGAAMNGIFTGCSLLPLHYAKEEGFAGERYMISMACGSLLANIIVLIIIILYSSAASNSMSLEGFIQNIPAWHFQILWRPAFMAGTLLWIAMFGSIMAVTYLGQGVGNSVVQTKILVSGLWGILWFKEITGCETITKWFLSASLTVAAIIWLSYERLEAMRLDAFDDDYSE